MKNIFFPTTVPMALVALLILAPAGYSQTVSTWDSPNASYTNITTTSQWSGGVLPNGAGDVGNITGTGPARILMNHSSAWQGTLNFNPAAPGGGGFQFASAGNTNVVQQLNMLTTGAILLTTSNNGIVNLMGSTSSLGNLTVSSGATAAMTLQNSNFNTGFNFNANVDGDGTLRVSSKRTTGTTLLQTVARGNISDVNIVLAEGRLEQGPSTTWGFSFRNNGDSINTISGEGTNNRLLLSSTGTLNIDLAGFDWNQTAERSWRLIDWSTMVTASGWSSAGGSVTSGLDNWTSTGTAYYNGADGRIWSYSDGGLDWSFTESTGMLAVIPEPGSLALFSLGLVSFVLLRRNRRP
jgi:hypothetical protein